MSHKCLAVPVAPWKLLAIVLESPRVRGRDAQALHRGVRSADVTAACAVGFSTSRSGMEGAKVFSPLQVWVWNKTEQDKKDS